MESRSLATSATFNADSLFSVGPQGPILTWDVATPPMNMNSNNYRRAALVIASLNRQAADALLERLPAEQAAAIRSAIMHSAAPSPNEQDSAIRDFLTPPGGAPAADSPDLSVDANPSDVENAELEIADAGVTDVDELAADVADIVDFDLADADVKQRSSLGQPTIEPALLRNLLALSDESLASCVHHERAATVAALATLLPGKRAAGMLRLLEAHKQSRALSVLGRGVFPNPLAARCLARALVNQQTTTRRTQQPCWHDHDALQAILQEVDETERKAMLSDLAADNPILARRLGWMGGEQPALGPI